MRYGIMYALMATVMVAATARPASAIEQGSTSSNIRLAIATEYAGEDRLPVQEVQYRGGTRRGPYYRAPSQRFYPGPVYRYPYRTYRPPYYRSPYYRSPYYRSPYRSAPRGFFFRGPRFGVGFGW
jgi:hypothetical protein